MKVFSFFFLLVLELDWNFFFFIFVVGWNYSGFGGKGHFSFFSLSVSFINWKRRDGFIGGVFLANGGMHVSCL